MSKWMVSLLLANPTPDLWSDARPKWALEMSLSELEFGRFPVWDESEHRKPRALLLPEEAKLFTASLALKLGVVKAGGKGLKTTTLVSEFWEAVGIEWLVSTNRTPNPNYGRRAQSKKEEWDWTR
jgi:hypothetical protein